jgi:hypothetical protein
MSSALPALSTCPRLGGSHCTSSAICLGICLRMMTPARRSNSQRKSIRGVQAPHGATQNRPGCSTWVTRAAKNLRSPDRGDRVSLTRVPRIALGNAGSAAPTGAHRNPPFEIPGTPWAIVFRPAGGSGEKTKRTPHPLPLSRKGRGEKKQMGRLGIPGLRCAPTWAIGSQPVGPQ